MLYIQLSYGCVKNTKQVQINLPNNYEEYFYLRQAPYLTDQNPAVENDLINLIRNRDDLEKWLLTTSKYGDEIQEDLNVIVGYDEKFTNVRHSLDLKDEAIFCNPNPTNVAFHDMKKFDLVNPVIGKLASQVKASKITDYELTKKILQKGEVDELQLRLDKLKYGIPKDDDDDKKSGSGGGSGGTPGPGPPRSPKTLQQEIDEITQRLDRLCSNTLDVSPYNTREENSRIIARKNNEKFVNQQIKQRQRELSKFPKGIVNNRRSSINFRLPDTPPSTPQEQDKYCRDVEENWLRTPASTISGPPAPTQPTSLFDYDRDFPPLSKHILAKNLPPINQSRETSFLSPEGSSSPLRNKLPNIAPLPSRPSVVFRTNH